MEPVPPVVVASELPPAFARSVAGLRTKVAYLKFHAAMRELPACTRVASSLNVTRIA